MFNTTGATFASAACSLLGIFYTVEWLLGIVAVAIFFVGIIKFIRNAGSTKNHQEGYTMMVWGVIAIFVIFSLQGILLLTYTSFLGSPTATGGSVCSSH